MFFDSPELYKCIFFVFNILNSFEWKQKRYQSRPYF